MIILIYAILGIIAVKDLISIIKIDNFFTAYMES
jgi:hypothetical protein